MDIQEIKEAFLEESEEYLNILQRNLSLFKKDFPNAEYETIVETYRAAHSIKGTAGFLALQNISQLSKAMEFAMMPLRDKQKDISMELIDKMLSATDFLQELINNIETSEDYSIEEMIKKLSE